MTTAKGEARGEVMVSNPIYRQIAKHRRCYSAKSDGVGPRACAGFVCLFCVSPSSASVCAIRLSAQLPFLALCKPAGLRVMFVCMSMVASWELSVSVRGFTPGLQRFIGLGTLRVRDDSVARSLARCPPQAPSQRRVCWRGFGWAFVSAVSRLRASVRLS